MKQDKALRKSLECKEAELPYGFDIRLMKRIEAIAERRNHREYVMNLIFAGVVSFIMLTGTFYALFYYFSFNILQIFTVLQLKFTPLMAWCCYISLLILVLLALDYKLRQAAGKRS
jgi:hypothetical protein